MSDYERYRVILAIGQVVATLISPLIVIKLMKKDQ
jgi:hypothetical protein